MWLSKFASGHSAVARTMHRWQRWDSATCPICQTVEEDMHHIFLCPDAERTAHWHTSIDSLQSWLTTTNTHPAISHCLLTTLHGRSLLSFSSNAHRSCQLAAHAQDQIGFFGLLLGRLSTHWETLQMQYGQQQNHPRSASTWAKGLCLQLLHITHGMWLLRNQQVQASLLAAQSQSLEDAIWHEFALGTAHLLLQDQFYISTDESMDGFTLQYVLSLPLSDQRLWLQSLQQARTRGTQTFQQELTQMRDSFQLWLQPDS